MGTNLWDPAACTTLRHTAYDDFKSPNPRTLCRERTPRALGSRFLAVLKVAVHQVASKLQTGICESPNGFPFAHKNLAQYTLRRH